tara:strand:+ start:1882 stop:4062 length:2181 start_codon:yes stop_codon:yes gene_type:complete
MSNWSSYKGQKLLTEGWRSYLKGDLYSGEKVEELFGMGKKKPQVRGSVSLNMLSEATGWASEVIQDVRKGPDQQPEGGRDWHERNAQLAQNPQLMELAQNTDEVAMITEFENMVTGQQFELISEQSPFERDDYRGGTAQTGHVRDPEAEEGEDLPLTFEPDGYENITNFIEIIKDSPEHVEKFVTELKRAGFSNCVDTLGCKKPAVEPGATGLVRKFRGPGGVNVSGVGGEDGGLKGGAKIDKKKEPEKVKTQQGQAAILVQRDGAVVATDTDGDGKIDDVIPMVERVLELLRQLCAYVVFPEEQRGEAMEQLERAIRPALEDAGTDELGQLIKELEEEIAQQGECVVPAQIGGDPSADQVGGPGDVKQLQGPDEILIDYQDSLNRAMEMARTGGIEDFEKDDFDLIYMAMADCNDESYVKFGEPSESSPMARGKWVNEAVDYDGKKCKDLRELGASPQFIHLVAKAISDVTDGIEYKEFFLNLPGAEIDDDGGGKGEDDGQGGGEDDGQGGGEDDGQGGGEDDGQGGGEDDGQGGGEDETKQSKCSLPQNWKPEGEKATDAWEELQAAYKLVGGENFEADWRDFAEQLCDVKKKLGSAQAEVQENKVDARTIAAILVGTSKKKAPKRKEMEKAFKAIFNNEGTGGSTIMKALRKMTINRTAPSGTDIAKLIHQTWSAVRMGTPAKESPDQAEQPEEPPVQQAAESLLRESTIDRWQQLAGIKKRV